MTVSPDMPAGVVGRRMIPPPCRSIARTASGSELSREHMAFTVPWLTPGAIFVAVYAVALVTTLVPAVRASRIYPAEALRYQ